MTKLQNSFIYLAAFYINFIYLIIEVHLITTRTPDYLLYIYMNLRLQLNSMHRCSNANFISCYDLNKCF
jgi:hypothetical protein